MKKSLVLGILFILPIVVYLFFASGITNFAKLPTLTKNVSEVSEWTTTSEQPVVFKNHITILGFLGGKASDKKSSALTLNEKIYKRFAEFNDFQFVMVMPSGSEAEAKMLTDELAGATGTDTKKWNFVFAEAPQIQQLFESLNTNVTLDDQLSTPYVFIIDKNKDLRGRNDDDDVGTLFGYDATSVGEINNKMVDDVKIILAEYRLALKKNTAQREK